MKKKVEWQRKKGKIIKTLKSKETDGGKKRQKTERSTGGKKGNPCDFSLVSHWNKFRGGALFFHHSVSERSPQRSTLLRVLHQVKNTE